MKAGTVFANASLGALKATGNRGLQPAMDHILQHESDPVPDLGSVSEQRGSRPAAADEMDADGDDEDMEALRQLGVNVPPGAGSAADEAKVSSTASWWPLV